MKRLLSLLLCGALFAPSVMLAAVRGNKSEYMGGTVSSINAKTQGKLYIGGNRLSFAMKHGKLWAVPFADVTGLAYGHKVGRRVGVAVGLALLTGPIGLVALFSKKKKHYVTIEFNSNPAIAKTERADFRANPRYLPKGDIAVFQVNKHDYKTVVELLQAKTGIHATMPPKAKWNNS